jgi:hypothetical protein
MNAGVALDFAPTLNKLCLHLLYVREAVEWYHCEGGERFRAYVIWVSKCGPRVDARLLDKHLVLTPL